MRIITSVSSSQSSVFCTSQETSMDILSDPILNVENTFNFLKSCCVSIINKLNKLPTYPSPAKINLKQEKSENKDTSMDVNCLYSVINFNSSSSSICLSANKCNEDMIFMNKQYGNNSSLLSTTFHDNGLDITHKALRYRNINERVNNRIHSEEIKGTRRKYSWSKSYSDGTFNKISHSLLNTIHQKPIRMVRFKESRGDENINICNESESKDKMSVNNAEHNENQYSLWCCDANILSSSSYQSSSYGSTLRVIPTRKKRFKKCVNVDHENRRSKIFRSFSEIEVSKTRSILMLECSKQNSACSIGKLKLNIEDFQEDDNESIAIKIRKNETQSSIFSKSCPSSSTKTDVSLEKVLSSQLKIDMSNFISNFSSLKRPSKSVFTVTSDSTDILSNVNVNAVSYDKQETLIIQVEDQNESAGNDENRFIPLREFLRSSKPVIYESIMGKPQHQRSRSFYSDNESKHCLICGRQEAKNRRYTLPACVAKGGTPLLRNKINPWSRVFGRVEGETSLKDVLDSPTDKADFLGQSTIGEKCVRTSRETREECGNSNVRRPLDATSCRMRPSNVEINVIDENEYMSLTITEYSHSNSFNWIYRSKNKITRETLCD